MKIQVRQPNQCLLTLATLIIVIIATSLAVTTVSQNWSGDVADRCFCKLQGEVDDCSCRVETLDSLNNNQIYPRLKSLLGRNYFRYFKVNLKKSCPFWTDDSRCALRDCHVDFCEEEKVPIKLDKEKPPEREQHEKSKYLKASNEASGQEEMCEEERELSALDTTISDETKAEFESWREHDEALPMFCEIDDEYSNDMEYVDLLLNPERYTGYKGPSPHRIWRSIYEENCFKPEKNAGYGPETSSETDLSDYSQALFAPPSSAMCLEKRVFYRLISGLHTSINVHLCEQYLHPSKNRFGPGEWGPNLEEFRGRFDPTLTDGQGPQRLKNLYFTYLVELRALAKAVPYLKEEKFYTGHTEEDEGLTEGIHDLLAVVERFPDQFDESQLFKVNSKEMKQLKSQFVHHFRNISRIMDCVGCDKCKLWGKLQVLGMGTALKILFSGDSMTPGSTVNADVKAKFQLTRTEIVALFNAFGRLSSSIHALETFRSMAR